MSWNTGLTGRALAIAQSTASPLRVIAGPGTGKSFAMKRRVARLLEEGVDASRILAVTFTRVAAEDVEKELHDLDIPGCEDIRAGTLHSFCFSVLHSSGMFELTGRIPRPLLCFIKSKILYGEGSPLLEDLSISGIFGDKRSRTREIGAFEAGWAKLQSDDPGWPTNLTERQFHEELIGWLRFHNAILIGELVPLTLSYLRSNPNATELTAYDYVIVDEYQDLNKAEQVLIDLLAQNAELFLVGDPDQSIYSFRYAHPQGIEEFGDTHPNTHDEPLDECRRCPQRVVQIADHLIQNNHIGDNGHHLVPRIENPEGEVHIIQWESLEEETSGLACYIKHLIDNCDYSPGDILVLSTRRLIGYGIRNLLREDGIHTHSYYYEEIIKAKEAQLALSLLSLLADREDRVALRFWLGYGSSSWRKGQYSNLRQYCEGSGLSPWEALEQLNSGQIAIPRTNQLLVGFRELLVQIQSFENSQGQELVDQIFPSSEEWADPIRESLLLKIEDDADIATLRDIVIRLVTQPESPEEGDFVRIMSIHKSKGLTSKAVIIAGCIHGIIPFEDSKETPEERALTLQEQRRLFYVAITRCEELLVISSFAYLDQSMAYNLGAKFRGRRQVVRTIASPFLSELGPNAPIANVGSNWENGDYQ